VFGVVANLAGVDTSDKEEAGGLKAGEATYPGILTEKSFSSERTRQTASQTHACAVEMATTSGATRHVLVRAPALPGDARDSFSTQVVSLTPGIRPEELALLLDTLFPEPLYAARCEPVALEDDEGNVVSLSVACAYPEVLSSPWYGIVRQPRK
jgi:hypothetical protein